MDFFLGFVSGIASVVTALGILAVAIAAYVRALFKGRGG